MSESKQRTNNRLTTKKTYELMNWLSTKGSKDSVLVESTTKIAEMATRDLGFLVNVSHVSTVMKALNIIPKRAPRKVTHTVTEKSRLSHLESRIRRLETFLNTHFPSEYSQI